jgi:hypothetical protein
MSNIIQIRAPSALDAVALLGELIRKLKTVYITGVSSSEVQMHEFFEKASLQSCSNPTPITHLQQTGKGNMSRDTVLSL